MKETTQDTYKKSFIRKAIEKLFLSNEKTKISKHHKAKNQRCFIRKVNKRRMRNKQAAVSRRINKLKG